LLELHPGDPGDAITTTLVTSDLGDNPFYEALSYVWGDMAIMGSILVNGQCCSITGNLYDALESLRTPHSTRVLWVDALCIHQEDISERNHQVSMMDDIYKTAARVIVYLGQATRQTEQDMENLQSFLAPYGRGEDAPWSHIPIPELKRSIGRILARPWFRRIWTVQEAVLAQRTTLQWGSHKIQWTGDLRTLRALVFRIKSAVVSPNYGLHGRISKELDWKPLLDILESQMRQAARREGVVLQRNLLDVAFDFHRRQCASIHDRYYAMLGIIENDQGGSLLVPVDYKIPVEELHEMFMAEVQRISEIEDAPLA
jgi:hypothetical protein